MFLLPGWITKELFAYSTVNQNITIADIIKEKEGISIMKDEVAFFSDNKLNRSQAMTQAINNLAYRNNLW